MVGRDGAPPSLATELDAVVATFEDTTADAEFVSREPLVTASGVAGEVLRYSIEQGTVSVKELWAADGDTAVSVAFITWNEGFAAMEPRDVYGGPVPLNGADLPSVKALAVRPQADPARQGAAPAPGVPA